MKTVVIYKDNTDYARMVSDYLRDFARQTGYKLETIDPDTREGIMFCQTYDIVEYPSIVALDDNGAMQNMWRGTAFPTINELSYYAH